MRPCTQNQPENGDKKSARIHRKLDFYFRFPFERYDTTVFKLPDGVSADALPEGKTQQSDYASCKSAYWYNEKENTIYSATTLILKRYRISSADYAGVKKFFDDLIQDDSQRIVLLNKPTEKKHFSKQAFLIAATCIHSIFG